jgi:hypothetical protein
VCRRQRTSLWEVNDRGAAGATLCVGKSGKSLSDAAFSQMQAAFQEDAALKLRGNLKFRAVPRPF